MDMTSAAGRNPIDENRSGLIGKPIDRVDGRLKVTGKAPYAYEVQEAPGQPAYGFIVEATIPKGRVADIEGRCSHCVQLCTLFCQRVETRRRETGTGRRICTCRLGPQAGRARGG